MQLILNEIWDKKVAIASMKYRGNAIVYVHTKKRQVQLQGEVCAILYLIKDVLFAQWRFIIVYMKQKKVAPFKVLHYSKGIDKPTKKSATNKGLARHAVASTLQRATMPQACRRAPLCK